jgi:NAD(P)-dependent dehydrogenase (short-subunit alcohol dehydrogenase family)
MSGTGTVVVVTGGTRGIGRGLVRAFLDRGCRVAFCGRSAASFDAAGAALGGGPGLVGVVTDVTDEAGLQKLWDAAVDAFGRVDVWINNAGISNRRLPFHELPADEVRAVVETNLVGAALASQVAVRGFLAQGSGQLWNMEGFGSTGQKAEGVSVYGATKRGLTYLTESIRKDLGKGSPVQVNLLSPGIVATDLLVDDYAGQPEKLERAKRVFNVLGDRVETVAPWLADKVLATDKGGARVAWLTPAKAGLRFATGSFRKRDIFAATGEQRP